MLTCENTVFNINVLPGHPCPYLSCAMLCTLEHFISPTPLVLSVSLSLPFPLTLALSLSACPSLSYSGHSMCALCLIVHCTILSV